MPPAPDMPPAPGPGGPTLTPWSAGLDVERARRVLARARAAGRSRLLEPEGLDLLEALGIRTPRRVFVPLGAAIDAAALAAVPGDRVVVKVVAEAIAHKSDVGGVAIAERSLGGVGAVIDEMAARLGGASPAGFLVAERVPHPDTLGAELLVSARWTDEFGPVVSVAAGGLHAELLASDLRPGRELAVVSPWLLSGEDLGERLVRATAVRLAVRPQRGQRPLGSGADLVDLVGRFLALAAATMPDEVAELEVNPVAVTSGGLIALDVLATLGDGVPRPATAPRPLGKLGRLLEPRTIAVAGVSSGQNPGRTVLRNVLRDGFPAADVVVVKPGVDQIDGCRCVPDVASLPGKVDLLVVALSAGRAAELVEEAVRRDAAETLLVIPGGLEETAGGRGFAARMRSALAEARTRPDGGPLINGGNCLGIRSRPGRYDTLFIPEAKLAAPSGHPAPLAIVAQSGAFAITRLDRLVALDPRYVITLGNQMDLTVGDYLEHLASDPSVDVAAVYVEGFRPGDGLRTLVAARAIADRGGVVVLYRAGRTPAGAAASASHTASIAGDAIVTSALAGQAGVVVAESLASFDDLVRTFTLLRDRAIAGRRLGALSNAGFECVAIGDNLGGLEIVRFDAAASARLGEILRGAGAGDVVDVHDPLDATPMCDDAAFAALAETILGIDDVDIGVVGVVPLTPALQTLPAGDGGEDLAGVGAVAGLLVDLWRRTTKAWVAVVDAGPRYDAFARALERGGIPTFRSADAAVRTLATVVDRRLRAAPPGPGPSS